MSRRITVEPMATGLNNQRLCLLGLVRLASDQGAVAVIPDELVDYTPEPKQKGRPTHAGRIATWDIFSRAEIDNLALPLAFDGDAEAISMHDCFNYAKVAMKADLQASTAFLRALAPARPIADHASKIVSWLGTFTALQLRIERDWREYMVKKFGGTLLETPDEHLSAMPEIILAKVAAAPELPRTIWACCDEDDLVETKDELKGLGDAYGLRLLFKSDLPAEFAYPGQRLLRSAIDFAVAVDSPAYVGLTRSTFSQMVGRYQPAGPQFIYNAPGDRVIESPEFRRRRKSSASQ